MHELALTQDIVALCSERAEGARVLSVTLEIGRLSAVLPDAVRFCFDLCTEETALEGAELQILEIAGRARCEACGAEMGLQEPYGRCACGSTHLQVIAGQELRIKQMEVL